MAGEASYRTTVSLAFEKKRNAEWCKLRKHLHLQLQDDIARIFTNSVYCDLELVFGSTVIKTHKSILQVRTSKFFAQLCSQPLQSNQEGSQSLAFNKASSDYVKDFVRSVYCKCVLSKEENNIVQYLKDLKEPHYVSKNDYDSHKIVRGASHDSGLSPESDIFLTPNCSPSDFCSSFCEEQFKIVNSDKAKHVDSYNEITNLHKTNRSYYTIVAVDEVFQEETNTDFGKKKSELDGVLERELAEQDELLKSFRSIKSKEENKSKTTKKLKKPTSLPVSSSLYTKAQRQSSSSRLFKIYSSKKDKHTSDSIQSPNFYYDGNKQCSPRPSDRDISESTQKKVCSLKLPSETEGKLVPSVIENKKCFQETSQCCFSCSDDLSSSIKRIHDKIQGDVVEEEDFMCSPEGEFCKLKCCQNKDVTEDLLTLTPCSPEMDASGGGPDSGLDTCSTGCIPGGGFNSPREHTVSETSGVDLTEAAIGEDMPHDGEADLNIQKPCKSSDSSSVSSEVGTWDTSFPVTNMQDVQDLSPKAEIERVSSNGVEADLSCDVLENSETSNNIVNEASEIVSKTENDNLMKDSQENLEQDGEIKCSFEQSKVKQNERTSGHNDYSVEHEVKYEITSDTLNISSSDAYNDSNARKIWTDSHNADMMKHRRKVSSLSDLQSEYLVDSRIPSSGDKCNEWKIDTSLGTSNNYFINAATLVDDSELPTSLPPLFIHEPNYDIKETVNRRASETDDRGPSEVLTKTPTSSPTEVTDKNKPSFMSPENIMTESGDKVQSAVSVSPRSGNENDIDSDQKEVSNGTASSSGEPSVMRVTFLKMGGTRHEVKLLNGQDLFAEFQKELRMTEHLEPQVGRKIAGGKIKWDSENVASEELMSSRNGITIDNSIAADDIQEKHETEPVNEDYNLKKLELEEKNSNTELEQACESIHTDKECEEDKNNEEDDIEPPRKSSLIRRNTFELDPDEEHIALLRQEYERRQGNLLFQNCIPQFSGHITGSEGFRDSQSLLVLGPESQEEIHKQEEQLMSLPSISVADPLIRKSMVDVDSSLPCELLSCTIPAEEHGNLYANFDHECVVTNTGSQSNYGGRVHQNIDVESITNESVIDKQLLENIPLYEMKDVEDASANTLINKSSEQSFRNETSGYSRQNSYDIACKPVISGALTCSDLGLEDKRLWDSPKKQQKRTESTPIVSGGVSTVDFSVPVRKVSESPIMRRKNEAAPILSGAAPVPLEVKETICDVKSQQTSIAPGAAWVVDMSDCTGNSAKPPLDLKKHRKSDSTCSSSFPVFDSVEEPSVPTVNKQLTEVKNSSLGFFVDLKVSPGKEHEIKPKDKREHLDTRPQKSLESTPMNVGYFVGFDDCKTHGKEKWDRKSSSFEEKRELRRQSSKNDENKSGKNSPCGYFIDLTSKGHSSVGAREPELKRLSSDDDKDSTQDRKSAIFSMFIDIGAGKLDNNGRHGSTESVKSKVASSPLLSSNKKLGFRRASSSREGSDKGSRPNSATFDIEDQLIPEDNVKCPIDAKTVICKSECVSLQSQPSSLEEISGHKTNKKQSFFMFIEHESPVIRRKTLPSGLRPSFNRHSWNPETRSTLQTEDARLTQRRQHKRAHSVSVDRSAICSPGDDHKSSSSSSLAKTQQQGSSHSLCESALLSELGMPQMSASCHARLSSKSQEKFTQAADSVEEQTEDARGKDIMKSGKHIARKMDVTECNNVKFNLKEANVELLETPSTEKVKELELKQNMPVTVQDRSSSEQGDIYVDQKVKSYKTDSKEYLKQSSEEIKFNKKVAIDSGLGESFQGAMSSDSNNSQHKDNDHIEDFHEDVNLDRKIETELERNHDQEECISRKKKETSIGNFVRLSDLDKEPAKAQNGMDSSDLLPSFSTTNRMTRSIPETSWIENKLLMTRSIGSGSTSKSLSRLFPHLHTAVSASSSSSVTYSKSPGGQMEMDDNDMQVSETSDLSSMQSSMGPSGLEGSTEETDASSSYAGRSGPVSRLGEDLLRMFLEEINPDVTVEVGGRRLKAHKCILSSRCQYFAAMLSGGWVESAGNVISLQGFSYNAVHFALCHIYSGTSNIPDTISIVELATLADMLGLEGLKEVIMYTLKVKYCHFFHKPCTMCTVGVLECLPLAAAYGLDEIYRKSLRWITKYFVRIWPTKGFASLPRELVEKCYQQHVVHMSVDNVLETVMCCDKLLATLPNVRWAEPIFGITSQLLESSIKYIANNFSGVLTSENFLSLGRELSWNISRLEDSIMAATDRLPPDQCCQSYSRLHQILSVARSPEPPPEMQWSQNFIELLSRIQKRVEASLVRQAPRAARCPSWGQMEIELRRKIQEMACLVLVPGEDMHRSRVSNSGKRGSSGNSNVYGTGPRSVSSSGLRSLDLRQVRLAMTQQARRAASGGRVSTLKADSKTKVQIKQAPVPQVKRDIAATDESSKASNGETSTGRPKTWPMRVLENKTRPVKNRVNMSNSNTGTPEKATTSATRRSGKIMISSSDSSRTSSPAMRRSAPCSEGSSRVRASTLTSASGRNTFNRSDTPPGRDLRNRRKRDGEVTAISTDSLTESPSNGSSKRNTKEISESTTSRSCISTRPDTPSVKRKNREDVTSTDSLSTVNADKAVARNGTSSNNVHHQVTRPDTPKDRKKNVLGKLGAEVTISTDSLATDSSLAGETSIGSKDGKSSGSNKSDSKGGKIVKVSNSKNEIRSPVSAIWKVSRQSTSSPRDSPTARVRSAVSSSPYTGSPSLRRSLLLASKSDNSPSPSTSKQSQTSKTTSTKSEKLTSKLIASPSTSSASSKRTPTRSQTRSQTIASPAKPPDGGKCTTGKCTTKDTTLPYPVNKTQTNKITVVKKTSNGTLFDSRNKRYTECSTKFPPVSKAVEEKHPSVGSRSGTFLKDEPTILRKPDIDNVQE